jgi:hypothetical protein
MKYKFEAPEFLDEEQVKELSRLNIITIKGKTAIWLFNPNLIRALDKISVEVK